MKPIIRSLAILVIMSSLFFTTGCKTTQTKEPLINKPLPTQTVTPEKSGTPPLSQETTNIAIFAGDTTLPGKITLKWKTESEQDNYGFDLYRSTSPTGPWTKITPSPVPGHGTTSDPHEYRFVDEGVFKFIQYYYQLEEIDLSGNGKRLPYTIKGMDKKVPETVPKP